MSLLEQDTTIKWQINEQNAKKLNANNKSGKYKVETI